ncbi:MAG: ABC transporter ATP-binding protein [Isosphaeraceae bacterium]|nr:ABC transporter ATP-binding protein [Isosphaeraceae bacterium]
MPSSESAPLPKPSLPRLRRLEAEFLRPYRGMMLLALASMLVQALLSLPVSLLQGWVIDRLVPLVSQGRALSTVEAAALLKVIGLGLLATAACHLGRMALGWKVAASMSRISLEVVRALTDAMHRKLQRLPMAFFDGQQTGLLMARVTNDVGSLLVFLNGGALQLASDIVLALGISAVLIWLHPKLALVALVAVPLYAVTDRLFARRNLRLARKVWAQIASIYALLSERISAVRVVRSFAQEDAELAELDRQIDQHRILDWASLRCGAQLGALSTLISGLGTVLVVTLGAALVGRGRLTVGELLAFYALVVQLYNPIVHLLGMQGMLAATANAVGRIIEVLDEPETLADRPEAQPIHRRPKGRLTFREVSFAYRPGGRLVLDRISLDIRPGEMIGLLGASGSGKSTLLALAPRLYDVPEGQGAILLDGQDIRGLKLADLRRSVALVPQQAMLFEGTIRSNLLYAAPDAHPATIRRALEAADLAAFVDALPLGLDTPVGERGQTLSGGQRQRLALARALVADPAVLLLDDCTSALDAETEGRIQAALAEILPGRTCILVSHKVSSVRRADRIVVLASGHIAEVGTHEELLARGGPYAETFHQQTGALVFA